jgi:hypothetical protein
MKAKKSRKPTKVSPIFFDFIAMLEGTVKTWKINKYLNLLCQDTAHIADEVHLIYMFKY